MALCQKDLLRNDTMARIKTWEFSDTFWALLQTLIPNSPRTEKKTYKRNPGFKTRR